MAPDALVMGLGSLRNVSCSLAIALPSVCSCASKGPPPDHDVAPLPAAAASSDATAGAKLTPVVAVPTMRVPLGAPQGAGEVPPALPGPPSVPARDSVIATLQASDIDLDALRQRIEEFTAVKVERIRKGPAGLLSVHFAPLSPPRTEADLVRLVERLRELPELRSVEPERRFRAQDSDPSTP